MIWLVLGLWILIGFGVIFYKVFTDPWNSKISLFESIVCLPAAIVLVVVDYIFLKLTGKKLGKYED